MAKRSAPRAPAGLGRAGSSLWKVMTGAHTFEPYELPGLEVACRQADTNAALEALIARDGMVVPGSTGQMRLNAAVTESRQGRLALSRLLAELSLPDAAEVGRSPASRRAQHAAVIRWNRERPSPVTAGPRRLVEEAG